MEVGRLRLLCNWENVNRAALRIWKELVRKKDSISGSYTAYVLKRLKGGGIHRLLRRPLAYDLWFTGCPDVPAGKMR